MCVTLSLRIPLVGCQKLEKQCFGREGKQRTGACGPASLVKKQKRTDLIKAEPGLSGNHFKPKQ